MAGLSSKSASLWNVGGLTLALPSHVAIDHPFPWQPRPLPGVAVGRLKAREYRLDCHLYHVLELRLQEGFKPAQITIENGEHASPFTSSFALEPFN